MKVGWKILLPMGLALLVLTAVVGMRSELWIAMQGAMHRP
jgi:NADH:ubiquinone oxidoreductase subunit H